jgi:hypothetical protein
MPPKLEKQAQIITDDHRKAVERLAAVATSPDDIAFMLADHGLNMTGKEVCAHFNRQIRMGVIKAKTKITAEILKNAQNGNIQAAEHYLALVEANEVSPEMAEWNALHGLE